MQELIERILHIIPHDYVVICPCGSALRMDDIHRSLIKCHKCGQEHNFHTLEMVTLANYVENNLKNLTFSK